MRENLDRVNCHHPFPTDPLSQGDVSENIVYNSNCSLLPTSVSKLTFSPRSCVHVLIAVPNQRARDALDTRRDHRWLLHNAIRAHLVRSYLCAAHVLQGVVCFYII